MGRWVADDLDDTIPSCKCMQMFAFTILTHALACGSHIAREAQELDTRVDDC